MAILRLGRNDDGTSSSSTRRKRSRQTSSTTVFSLSEASNTSCKSKRSGDEDNDDSSEAFLHRQQMPLKMKKKKKNPLHSLSSLFWWKHDANVRTTRVGRATTTVSSKKSAAAAHNHAHKKSDIILAGERNSITDSVCTNSSHDQTTPVSSPTAASTRAPTTESASSTTGDTSVACGSPCAQCLPPRRLLQELQRELRYYPFALEASWCILWFCVGHFSLYMVVETTFQVVKPWLLGLFFRDVSQSDDMFYFCVIVCGFVAMRWNGHLWEWLPSSSYDEQRRRRRRLRPRTTTTTTTPRGHSSSSQPLRLLLEQNPFWNSAFSTVAYYFVYVGSVYFYYRLWALYEAGISEYYKEWEATWITMIHDQDGHQEPMQQLPLQRLEVADAAELEKQYSHCQALFAESSCPSNKMEALLSSIGAAGRTWVCQQFRNPTLPLPCLFLFGSVLIIASVSMAAIGGSLLEEYDEEEDEDEDEE